MGEIAQLRKEVENLKQQIEVSIPKLNHLTPHTHTQTHHGLKNTPIQTIVQLFCSYYKPFLSLPLGSTSGRRFCANTLKVISSNPSPAVEPIIAPLCVWIVLNLEKHVLRLFNIGLSR